MIRRPISCAVWMPVVPEAARWLDICGQYITRHRYEVVAVVNTWPAAVEMLTDGRAAVLVAGRRDHLPATRSPRLEIVTEEQMLSMSIAEQRPARRTLAQPF